MTDGKWIVYVDDNFHDMDEDERYCLGVFESFDLAVAACQKIVDDFLQDNLGGTAEALYDHYTRYGNDPWIQGPTPQSSAQRFSAWDYAMRRCNELLPKADG